jgi:transposase
MRPLVQPPPSTRCSRCRGELRLKRVDPDDGPFESMKEIFVCASCGHELSCIVLPDKYAGLVPSSRRR